MKLEYEELERMLISAYQGTCHQHNTKNDIDNIDIGGQYEILERLCWNMQSVQSDWRLRVILLHSDGGVQEFMLLCEIAEFKFLLIHWKNFSYNPINSYDLIPNGFKPFVEFLYNKLVKLPDVKTTKTLVWNTENN